MDGVKLEFSPFEDAKELVQYAGLNTELGLGLHEARTVMGYLDGHGYAIQEHGCRLYVVNMNEEELEGEEYTLDDIIENVYELNDDLIQQTNMQLENPTDHGHYEELTAYLEQLRADEVILDCLFDRTSHGKNIDQLADLLGNMFVEGIKEGKGIDESVSDLVSRVKQYKGSGKKVL